MAGKSSATRMPMIAITKSNSTNVNALRLRSLTTGGSGSVNALGRNNEPKRFNIKRLPLGRGSRAAARTSFNSPAFLFRFYQDAHQSLNTNTIYSSAKLVYRFARRTISVAHTITKLSNKVVGSGTAFGPPRLLPVPGPPAPKFARHVLYPAGSPPNAPGFFRHST